jgi:hypothetical protein
VALAPYLAAAISAKLGNGNVAYIRRRQRWRIERAALRGARVSISSIAVRIYYIKVVGSGASEKHAFRRWRMSLRWFYSRQSGLVPVLGHRRHGENFYSGEAAGMLRGGGELLPPHRVVVRAN